MSLPGANHTSRSDKATSRPSRIKCTIRASGKSCQQVRSDREIARRLVSPPGLAVAAGVERVDGAGALGERKFGQAGHLGGQFVFPQSQIAESVKTGDVIDERPPVREPDRATRDFDCVGRGEESERGIRFPGGSLVRVGVEHEAQQRGAGTTDADDERHPRWGEKGRSAQAWTLDMRIVMVTAAREAVAFSWAR